MRKSVILLNPPIYFSQGQPRALDVSVPPLGLLYLASYINKNLDDFRAEVVDLAPELITLNKLTSIIKRKKPMAVGVTAMTPQLQGALELGKHLKKFFPHLKIFLGGPHVSADPDIINRFSHIFDYGITGEAEITFADSLVKLGRKKKIPKLQKGKITSNLDIIPRPDRRLIKREKYSPYESIIFSRGCPFQCYFCSRPSISRNIRYRSAGNLIEEIKANYRFCQGKIDFQDDTFTLDRKRVLEFCLLVEKEKLKLSWRCNTRIDLVDEIILKKMKAAGCDLIHFGIEAGNERIRKNEVNKGIFRNQDIYRVIALCHKLGIKFAGYFMIGHPNESKKEILETKNMILNSGIDLMGLSIPTPFPGSRLYGIAQKEGLISTKLIDEFAEKKLGEGYVGNYPVYISKKANKEDVFALMREINRKFYLNWHTFWRRLSSDLGSLAKIKKDFNDFISLVIKGVSSRKPYTAHKKI